MLIRNNRDDIGLFEIIGATALGALIGVGVGLLVAPKSGEEMRGDIASTGKDLYKKAKSKTSDIGDDFEDFRYEFEDMVEDELDKAEEKLKEAKRKL